MLKNSLRERLIVFFLLSSILSCNSSGEIKEYYDNGSLKSVFQKKDGQYDGVYSEYHRTGGIKERHIYKEGEKIDSSVYYNETDKFLDHVDYYGKDIDGHYYRKYFYSNGILKKEGKLLTDKLRIGKWKYYSEDGHLIQAKEFKNIDDEVYLNQDWYFKKNGDTISGKGSHYSIRFDKDTINLNEPVQAIVNLKEPLFKDENSSIMAIVPKDYSMNFDDTFSNEKLVQVDTILNLNLEKEYREAVNLKGDHRKKAFFGRYFNSPGWKDFRGIIVEYYYTDSITPDSLNYFEHKKYFEKKVYVRDTLNNTD